MARASITTLLSLDRFAKIMGINGAHYNQAYSDHIMPQSDGCSDIWYQHPWQAGERISREEVAEVIATCEYDIARAVGYWPAPKWTVEEVHAYPRHYRPEVTRYGMQDARGFGIGLRTKFGKVIAGGQRMTVCYAPAATVVYSDADGDGHTDTATVTLATTLTDIQLFKVFFPGRGGEEEWEIRDPRNIVITGGNLIITFWPWQLIKPALWDELTSSGRPEPIDFLAMTGPVYDNLVATVDICQVYNATDAPSAMLYWEPTCDTTSCCCGGSGCTACLLTTQDGCIHVRNADEGLVVPTPASYDQTEEAWASAAPTLCRDPDFVKIWYYSGELADAYKDGRTWEPLTDWWAQTIAYLAAARLDKPVCSCPNVSTRVAELQTDLAFSGQAGMYNMSPQLLANPFGTRKGEVYAWRRISSVAEKRAKVAIL